MHVDHISVDEELGLKISICKVYVHCSYECQHYVCEIGPNFLGLNSIKTTK